MSKYTLTADVGFKEHEKIKTPFARIVVGGRVEKPCYSIMYYDTENKCWWEAYSSYCLDNVFEWLEQDFEITENEEEEK